MDFAVDTFLGAEVVIRLEASKSLFEIVWDFHAFFFGKRKFANDCTLLQGMMGLVPPNDQEGDDEDDD